MEDMDGMTESAATEGQDLAEIEAGFERLGVPNARRIRSITSKPVFPSLKR